MKAMITKLMHMFRGHAALPVGSARALRWVTTLAVGLVLTMLPLDGPALARAERVTLSGTVSLRFGPPERAWVADGWEHFRGFPSTGAFAFSGAGVALAGTAERLDNLKHDAAGNGELSGVATFRDAATGLTCAGRSQGKLTRFLLVGSVVARCSDGALLTGTIRDTGVITDSAGQVIGVTQVFSGVLLTPDR
jgi:hypothetical protein